MLRRSTAGRVRWQPRTSTFASLRVPAFRSFFLGQAVSLPGTWMQTVGQSWLVIELTGSGTLLGTVVAAQYLPVLLLAPWGGVLADRFPRRWLLMSTQVVMAVCAALLGALTLGGLVTVGSVMAIAVVFGVATAVDNPTRQSFVLELVGPDLVRNAVSLNSALLNAARAVGPAIAGIVIVTVGPGWCFVLNAVSFIGVIIALALMRLAPRTVPPADGSALAQLLAGFRHIRGRTELLWPCLMIFLVGAFAWVFPVTLPILAKDTFAGDARTFGWLTSAMGVGAVLGALFVAGRGKVGLLPIAGAATIFGTALMGLALSSTVEVAIAAMVVVGWGGASFLSISNATIQLASEDRYRGRVMAMWSLAFIGSTPIGGPVVGAIGEHASARLAVGAGAAACLAAAVILVCVHRLTRHRPSHLPMQPEVGQ